MTTPLIAIRLSHVTHSSSSLARFQDASRTMTPSILSGGAGVLVMTMLIMIMVAQSDCMSFNHQSIEEEVDAVHLLLVGCCSAGWDDEFVFRLIRNN